jgi:hypothetical protein
MPLTPDPTTGPRSLDPAAHTPLLPTVRCIGCGGTVGRAAAAGWVVARGSAAGACPACQDALFTVTTG